MKDKIFIQYLLFLINGGLIGLLAIVIQLFFFNLLGGGEDSIYAIAAGITYLPLIVLNFLIQRNIIFSQEGRIFKFFVANLIIMVFVSAISPACRSFIAAVFGVSAGDNLGFVLAALIGATPSFLMARFWVFHASRVGT